jgi:hypothetical protein
MRGAVAVLALAAALAVAGCARKGKPLQAGGPFPRLYPDIASPVQPGRAPTKAAAGTEPMPVPPQPRTTPTFGDLGVP